MKTRQYPYGNKNIIGKNVEHLRKKKNIKQKDFIAKIQSLGVDINPTSFSKLEGGNRIATDREVYAIAKALGVSIETLFN